MGKEIGAGIYLSPSSTQSPEIFKINPHILPNPQTDFQIGDLFGARIESDTNGSDKMAIPIRDPSSVLQLLILYCQKWHLHAMFPWTCSFLFALLVPCVPLSLATIGYPCSHETMFTFSPRKWGCLAPHLLSQTNLFCFPFSSKYSRCGAFTLAVIFGY